MTFQQVVCNDTDLSCSEYSTKSIIVFHQCQDWISWYMQDSVHIIYFGSATFFFYYAWQVLCGHHASVSAFNSPATNFSVYLYWHHFSWLNSGHVQGRVPRWFFFYCLILVFYYRFVMIWVAFYWWNIFIRFLYTQISFFFFLNSHFFSLIAQPLSLSSSVATILFF